MALLLRIRSPNPSRSTLRARRTDLNGSADSSASVNPQPRSGLIEKSEEAQVNTLIYCMGDDADDILQSFQLTYADSKKYETIKNKF